MNAEQIRKRANFFRRSAPEMEELLDACADVVEAAMRERCTVLPCENGCAICMAIAKLEGIAP